MINDKNFEQEAQQLIEKISEAKYASFFELAKIADLDLLKDFAGSDMSGTNLSNGILRDADLRNSNLRGANLRGTDLRDADLRGVDLRDADLRGAKLQRAILIDVKVKGAKFDWLSLDLSEDIKLTLKRQGAIFENFLEADSVSLENQKMKEYGSFKMERFEEMNTITTDISSLQKKDGLTAVISSYEAEGRYLDKASLERMKSYFTNGEIRLRACDFIAANASTIIKRAVAQSLLNTEVINLGGNTYSTRHYVAACVRDLDIFLRYCTYALLVGNASILDERLLNGLKETYISLGVPIMPTINAIQTMKEISISLIDNEAGEELGIYLDYICTALA